MEPGNPESVLPVWVQLEMWGGNRQTAAQLISLAVELGEKYRDQLGDWRFHWAMKGGVVQGIWEKQRVSDRSKELDMEEAMRNLLTCGVCRRPSCACVSTRSFY
jgi:hypothetical protein